MNDVLCISNNYVDGVNFLISMWIGYGMQKSAFLLCVY